MRLRWSFRLNPRVAALEFWLRHRANTHPYPNTVNVHRFEETINGREYHIEVSSVGRNQWRAQIARAPGGSAATMPFYGKTPDEAAHHLSHWLMVANGQGRSQL